MLTFRKALAIAFLLLACIYLFTSRATPRQYETSSPESARSGNPSAEDLSAAKGSKAPDVTYGQPLKGDNDKAKSQQPMVGPGKTMVERLRYQFPYDPDGKFPAYIWQTWKVTPASGDFGDSLRPQEASWTELHPEFVHQVIDDEVAPHLIRYLYASIPEVLDAYNSLPVPVLKADFFRYLILLARGGIYSDIDTEALKSATEWIPKEVPPSTVGLIVGIEADPDRPDWKDWYSRRIQFCQWTIQAKPGHPVLRSIVAQITEETLRMKKAGTLKKERLHNQIIEFTGPARWTDNVFAYFNNPEFFKMEAGAKNITWEHFTGMQAPKKVGDVVVLPITSFSPDVGTMGAKDKDDPMAFVKHEFEGSWKESWEHVKPLVGDDDSKQ